MTDKRDSLLNKINALLNKTTENGATEAEAMTALAMAQKLMEKHMIESYELTDNAKEKNVKCERVVMPLFKTGYDTTDLNPSIASCFDCEVWWNTYRKDITFFGYGSDARLASYFYNFINNAIVIEANKYKRSLDFVEQKINGYHARTIMASFRKGMIVRIIQRLKQLKAERKSNVIKKTGTDLVIVKDEIVKSEYDTLGLKIKMCRSSLDDIQNAESFHSGMKKGDDVNLSGGIEQNKTGKIKQ